MRPNLYDTHRLRTAHRASDRGQFELGRLADKTKNPHLNGQDLEELLGNSRNSLLQRSVQDDGQKGYIFLEKILDIVERLGIDPKKLPHWMQSYILAKAIGGRTSSSNPYGGLAQAAAAGLAGIIGAAALPAMAQTVNVHPITGGQQGQELKGFGISYNLRSEVLRELKIKEDRKKAVRNLLYRISTNASYIDGKINWTLVGEGFVPLYYNESQNSLTGIQFKGEYAKVEGGDHKLEFAAGVVVNKFRKNNSKVQLGVFYQNLQNMNMGTNFGVASITAAYTSGPVRISLYAGVPLTGERLLSTQTSTSTSTSAETSGGNKITRTTSIEKIVKEYMEARKVATLVIDYKVSDRLTLSLGGIVYYGVEGSITSSDNTTRTKQGVPEEKRIILGLTYELSPNMQLKLRGLIGDGEPKYEGGIVWYFGQPNNGANRNQNGADVNNIKTLEDLLAKIENVQVIRWTLTDETTTRSPKVSSTCATEVIVDEDYTCTFTVSEGKISSIKLKKGPSFLSFSGNTLLGKPEVDDIGSHSYEVEVKGSLETIVSSTLKVNDVETLTGTYTVTPTSGTSSLATTHKIEINGGKAPYKIKIKYDDGTTEEITSTTSKSHSKSHTYSSGTFKPEVTIEDKLGRTKTLSGSTVEVASTLSGIYSVSPTSGVASLATTHTVNISGGKGDYTTKYDFNNDGTIDKTVTTSSASDSQSHTYTSSGTFTSKVIIEDKLGNSKTLTNSIEVVATLSGSYSVTPTSGVTPLATTHTISIIGGKAPFVIKYDFNGDNVIDKTVTTSLTSDIQSNTYSSAGTFTPKATLEDALGQSKALTGSTVTTVSPLEAACSGSPTSAERIQTVTWTATASGGTGTYTFNWTGDATGTPQSVSASYTTSGTKTGTVAVTSNGQSTSVSCSVNVLDPLSISINDVTVAEGDSGTTNATFTVSLSRTSNVAVTLNFTTQDGTATAGSDYNSTSGTLTIPAGSTSGTITVQVIGDTDVESDKTFKVKLSNPSTHSTITDDEGVGTIQNDDVAPPPPPPPG